MVDAQNSGNIVKRVRGRPFQKGQVANPGGRPKGSLTDVIRAEMAKLNEQGESNSLLLSRRVIALAIGGNIEAIKILLERMDGKVPELRTIEGTMSIALSWDDGNGDGT